MELTSLLEPVTVVADFDDLAAMCESIEKRSGHLRIAKDAAPFAEGQVGGHDQRDAFIEYADQMEQQRAAVLRSVRSLSGVRASTRFDRVCTSSCTAQRVCSIPVKAQ